MRTRIGLAVVVTILGASSCAGRAVTAAVSPSAASTTVTPSGPQPAEAQRVLSPGVTYYTARFRPRITFTLRQTWWLDRETRWYMIMNPGDAPQSEENVVLLDVQRVFEPSNQRMPVPAPKDLVGWFLHHPGINILGKPHPVEIGGVRGTEFDSELGKAPLCPPNPNLPAGTHCWFFAPFGPGDPFSAAASANGPPFGAYTTDQGTPERGRTELIDIHGRHLLIGYGDYGNTFGSTVRQFEQLLQAIRFG